MGRGPSGAQVLRIDANTADLQRFYRTMQSVKPEVHVHVATALHRYAGEFYAVAHRNLSGNAHKRRAMIDNPTSKRARRKNLATRRMKVAGVSNKIAGDAVLNLRTGRLRGGLKAKGFPMGHRVWNDVYYGWVWETGRRTKRGIDQRPWFSTAWEEIGGNAGYVAALGRGFDRGLERFFG